MAFDEDHYFLIQVSNSNSEGTKTEGDFTYATRAEATVAFFKFGAHYKYVWLMEWGEFTNKKGELVEDWITYKIHPIGDSESDVCIGNGYPSGEWGNGLKYQYKPLTKETK
jgi:hypothetical protein